MDINKMLHGGENGLISFKILLIIEFIEVERIGMIIIKVIQDSGKNILLSVNYWKKILFVWVSTIFFDHKKNEISRPIG